jgi:4-hydroxy-2-oxoheptanedioate aldolase
MATGAVADLGGRTPPRFLGPGDVLHKCIKGIGELVQTFTSSDEQSCRCDLQFLRADVVACDETGAALRGAAPADHRAMTDGRTVSDPRYTDFAARIRARERVLGYWVVLDSPISTERIARIGYDYIALDAQHGLLSYSGLLAGLTAIDAGGRSVGLVRVEANDPTPIGKALDAGAAGVIVPLVDDAAQAAATVTAAKYPPTGRRSYGPVRSGLRVGPTPAESDATTVVLAMIETSGGLANVAEICATPGIDGVYVGPADLCLALGGAFPRDPAVADEFQAALTTVREAAAAAGVAAGIHTDSGEQAAQRLTEGFTFATVASDLAHLEQATAAHFATASGTAPTAGPTGGGYLPTSTEGGASAVGADVEVG